MPEKLKSDPDIVIALELCRTAGGFGETSAAYYGVPLAELYRCYHLTTS